MGRCEQKGRSGYTTTDWQKRHSSGTFKLSHIDIRLLSHSYKPGCQTSNRNLQPDQVAPSSAIQGIHACSISCYARCTAGDPAPSCSSGIWEGGGGSAFFSSSNHTDTGRLICGNSCAPSFLPNLCCASKSPRLSLSCNKPLCLFGPTAILTCSSSSTIVWFVPNF